MLASTCAFVLACIWIPVPTISQNIEFTSFEASSLPQVIGYEVTLQTNMSIMTIPNNPFLIEWYYNNTVVWEVIHRGSSNIKPGCKLSDCGRFLVGIDNSTFPHVVHNITIKELDVVDNGTLVQLVYVTSEVSTFLNVKVCVAPQSDKEFVVSQTMEGDLCGYGCTVQCQKGYNSTNSSSEVVTCRENASFSPSLESLFCDPIVCQVYLTEEEVLFIGTNVTNITFGEVAFYMCGEGFTGTASIICNSDGSFENNIECLPVYGLSGGIIAVIVIFGGGCGLLLLFGRGLVKKKCFDKSPSPPCSPHRISLESPETTSPLSKTTADE